MRQPMVRLDGVTAAPERGAPPVLRDLSLALEAGTTTAVTGPNGAGKSTLCRVVAGLVAPAREPSRWPVARSCPVTRRTAWPCCSSRRAAR